MIPVEWHPWLMGGLLLAMLAALARGRPAADIVFMGGLLTLLVTGVLEPVEAVRGFAHPGVITVAMLYIVAAAMRETGAMAMITTRLIGRPKSLTEAQLRLTLPVAGMSAFVNNTPIVAMFLPILAGVAKRSNLQASKLFMPLSFASILGGVCTLIGTSTNVIVAGMLVDEDVRTSAGEPVRIGMFTLSLVGLPIAIAGLVYIMVFGRRLLPGAQTPVEQGRREARQYMTAMRVSPGAPIAGKTVEQAGLRALHGLFLSRIDRGERPIMAVSPDEIVKEGDALIFVGELESVADLAQVKGLVPVADESDPEGYRPDMNLVEAVVSTQSDLVGRTVRESGVRTAFGAVVVAVHRRGHRLTGKIGDIRLASGDTLLLEAPRGFAERHGDSPEFYLVTEHAKPAALRHERAYIALAVMALLIATLSFGWLDPMTSAMAAAGTMVIFRCCTGPQARAGMNWPVLIVIGASFGIAEAMDKTGLASGVAHAVSEAAGGMGPHALLAAVYLMTVLFSAMMTNNAAAVLMFPIVIQITSEAGLNPLPFAAVIAIAASCEFSTPIGYQTNLMVMGPGGYKWLDYTRFGGPLTILAAIICILVAPLVLGPLQ